MELPSGEIVRYVRVNNYKGVPGVVRLIVPQGNDKPYRPDMGVCRKVAFKPKDVVVDIGAYVGTFSLMAAAAGVRRVLACEPSPRQLAILRRNARPWSNLQVLNAAVVGDDRRKVKFYPGRHGIADSFIASRQRSTPIVVPAVCYKDVTALATVVKMDIEGGEYRIDLTRPSSFLRTLIVDFHRTKDWAVAVPQIGQALRAKGFKSLLDPKFDAPVTFTMVWVR